MYVSYKEIVNFVKIIKNCCNEKIDKKLSKENKKI